jgi:hypothetical protein
VLGCYSIFCCVAVVKVAPEVLVKTNLASLILLTAATNQIS